MEQKYFPAGFELTATGAETSIAAISGTATATSSGSRAGTTESALANTVALSKLTTLVYLRSGSIASAISADEDSKFSPLSQFSTFHPPSARFQQSP